MATKEQIDAAEKKVYSQQQIGEFMTTWKDFPRPGLAAWSERSKAGLMSTATSTRYTPKFRPFDMLSVPNQSLVILENANHRIGAECVVGVQDAFHRYVDCDMVYFQFCGNTTLETEFGVYEMEPGEVVLVPGGISHRSIGRNDSLRYSCLNHEAVDYVLDEDKYTSHQSFVMTRHGGPNWKGLEAPNGDVKGRVTEKMHFWDDGPDDLTVVERDYDSLVGVSTLKPKQQESGIRKLRAFDHFTMVLGKAGGEAGLLALMESASMRVRTYNMQDEQFAFHRALQSEESPHPVPRRCPRPVGVRERGGVARRDHHHPPGDLPQCHQRAPGRRGLPAPELLQQAPLARPHRPHAPRVQQHLYGGDDGSQGSRLVANGGHGVEALAGGGQEHDDQRNQYLFLYRESRGPGAGAEVEGDRRRKGMCSIVRRRSNGPAFC